MYIPEKLKVKIDTHRIINNMPIAFITYKDEHGKLRNETSWTKWSKIELPDIDNTPLAGYKIFDDDVTKRLSYFGSGRTLFNVCHPNGFFFEISSDNLAELVCNCEIKKGAIQGDCVLAWDKTSFAILPTSSNEYQENVKHTQMINNGTVKLSDLKIGTAYCDRNRNNFGYYCGTAKVINFDINEYRIGGGWGSRDFEFEATASCRILHVFKRTEPWNVTTGIANPKVFVDTNVAPDVSKAVYNIEDALGSHKISFPSELKTEDEVKEFIMNHPKVKNKLEDPRCVGGFVKYGFGSIKKMLK